MENLFDKLWNASPELMSVLIIIAILVFISVKVTQFYNRFTTLENDVAELKMKMDMVIEYLITGNADVLKKRKRVSTSTCSLSFFISSSATQKTPSPRNPTWHLSISRSSTYTLQFPSSGCYQFPPPKDYSQNQ